MRAHYRGLVVLAATTTALATANAHALGLQTASVFACGAVITADTTLGNDLTDCPGDGLIIDADDITVNLNEHTIDGDGVPAADGFDLGIRVDAHHGITLTNGAVQRFDRGIVLAASTGNLLTGLYSHDNAGRGIMLDNGSDANAVVNNHAARNGRSGISIVGSDNNVVTSNLSEHNTLNGVFLTGASHNRILGNTLLDDGSGVGMDNGSDDNVVSATMRDDGEGGVFVNFSDRNVVTHNRVLSTGSGVSLESADNNTITDNQVLHSPASACDGCGIGIQIYGNNNLVARNTLIVSPRYGIEVDDFQDPGHSPATGNVLRDNVVNDSGEGIAIGSEAGGVVLNTLIEGNIVAGAADDGIQLIGPSTGLQTSTLTRNVTVHNGDLGIETVPGTIDGGGNHAAANGNPLQCTNIVCH
jgi:parallel beta-helix repeat protein